MADFKLSALKYTTIVTVYMLFNSDRCGNSTALQHERFRFC